MRDGYSVKTVGDHTTDPFQKQDLNPPTGGSNVHKEYIYEHYNDVNGISWLICPICHMHFIEGIFHSCNMTIAKSTDVSYAPINGQSDTELLADNINKLSNTINELKEIIDALINTIKDIN